jgi:hypothetical protein
MTADSAGNDVLAVGIPVTGSIGFAPFGTVIPTPAEGGSDTLVLDPAFVKIGLLKEDGGPQFAWAADGDPITFWQDGYRIPSGLANVTLAITAAEVLAAQVRQIIAGIAPDANGYLEVDGGGHATQWVVFTEEIFKNGAIRRRVAPNVTLASSEEDQSTRGEINGNALTFNIDRSPAVNNKHFGEWVLPAEDPGVVKKTSWAVTVNGAPTGGTYTLRLNGVATAPIAFDAVAADVAAALNAISGVTGVSGITASGTSTITVTAPTAVALTGTSALTGGTTPGVTVA